MNSWIIQTSEPIPLQEGIRGMRTAILVDKLLEKGHSVVWFTSAFDHFKKEWLFKKETEIMLKDGLKIVALKGIGYKKNISLLRFVDHRITAWKFRKIAHMMQKPDVIIANMPHDIAYEAVIFAKGNNIPVLIDIRDPWPDIFLNHVPTKLRKIAKIFLYKDFQMIKKTMKMVDGKIAATNTFLEWGLNYAGREKTLNDRVFPLGYKKQKVHNDSHVKNRFSYLAEKLKDKFIIFFVGTISKSYHNPLILVEAAKKLVNYNDIHFIIAGDGELFLELEKDTQNLSNVTVTGWLDKKEIEFFLQHSKIGVCPVTTVVDLPTNKAYAYLSAGLPIISAFRGDLKEVIEKYQVGLYYPPNDVDALVGCIKKLYEDRELYQKMSENAARVFNEMFDADKIYEEYVEHIEEVVARYK